MSQLLFNKNWNERETWSGDAMPAFHRERCWGSVGNRSQDTNTAVMLERGWRGVKDNRHVWFWCSVKISDSNNFGHLFAPEFDCPGQPNEWKFPASVKITKTHVGYADQADDTGDFWDGDGKLIVPHEGGAAEMFDHCFETCAPVEPLIDLLAEYLPNVMKAYEIIVANLTKSGGAKS